MLRHYVTYFDANYVGPATIAVTSFLRTHEFDRLSLVTPPLVTRWESTPTWILSRVVRSLVALDPRVEHVPVDEVIAKGEDSALRELLVRGRISPVEQMQLFCDTLRAYLYPWCGHPVVWFDSDMMFVGDTSDVFRRPWTEHGAAAPDIASMIAEQSGLAMYRRFVDHVNDAEPGALPQGEPRNAGFLLTVDDVRPAFAAGLRHSIPFVQRAPEPFAHFLSGHLAWNYALNKVGAGTLPARYNMLTDVLPDAVPGAEAEDHLVRHYCGSREKGRMNLDFALWHAGAGGLAVSRSHEWTPINIKNAS
jgi:hypothetical protein